MMMPSRSARSLTAMDGGLFQSSMTSEELGFLPGGNAENAEAVFG
jgi:hypothetical protein